MKKKIYSVLLAGAAAAVMVGCSSQTSAPSEAVRTQETTKAESAAETTAAAEAAAAEELPYYVRGTGEITGTITVYTTMEETQQTVLKNLWNKYYPDCKIEIQADSVGTLAARIRGDETCDADVVIGGLFESDGDMYHDILQPYTSSCDEEQLYHDESGYYTYYDVQIMSLVVNPEIRDELGIQINGYEDLLNPALKGKIILAAPDATSSGWRQLQTILAAMGDTFDDDKGWAYIEQLMPMCFSSTSSKDVYNLVSNGEYAVGLSYESSVVALIQDGAPIECVYMEEGNTGMASGGAIAKNAPNLPAAEAMMDLLASTEFQSARAQESSGRGSNSSCELFNLPDEAELNLIPLDFEYLAENKAQICDHWNQLWAELN